MTLRLYREGRRQKAEGRRQKAEGRGQEENCENVSCRDQREQGLTPTERKFSGSKSVGVESPTDLLLLPPASYLLQYSQI